MVGDAGQHEHRTRYHQDRSGRGTDGHGHDVLACLVLVQRGAASTPPSIAPRSHPRAPHTELGIERSHKSAVRRSRTTAGTQFGRSNAAAEAARTMLALGGAKAASAVSFYSLALGSAGRIGPFQMERSKERLVRNLTQEGSKNKSDASSVRWKSVFAADRKLQIDWGEGKKKFRRPPVRDMTLFCASNYEPLESRVVSRVVLD